MTVRLWLGACRLQMRKPMAEQYPAVLCKARPCRNLQRNVIADLSKQQAAYCARQCPCVPGKALPCCTLKNDIRPAPVGLCPAGPGNVMPGLIKPGWTTYLLFDALVQLLTASLAMNLARALALALAHGHCPAAYAGQAHGNAKQDWSMAGSAMSFHGLHCKALPKASALQACSPVLHTDPCCIQLKGKLHQLTGVTCLNCAASSALPAGHTLHCGRLASGYCNPRLRYRY